MASKEIKHVNELFQMGGQPGTLFSSVNSKGEITELLWLEAGFSHSYGIDRLWLDNEWLDDPILLHICKQSGGNVEVFEGIFYNSFDLDIDKKDLLGTIEEALILFVTIRSWAQSKAYMNLVNLLESKSDAVYTKLILDYLKEKELQKDLDKLIETLNRHSKEDKIFKEICF